MRALAQPVCRNELGEFRRSFSTEHQVRLLRHAGSGESLDDAEFIFVGFSIAYTQEIRKGKSVNIAARMVGGINATADIDHFFRGDCGPLDDLHARKFRNSQNAGGTMTVSLQNCGIVQPDKWAAVFRAINMTEIVDRKNERCGTSQRSVVSR